METEENKIELGGLFYPSKDQNGKEIPFDSLFIPYIYSEIYFEGVYKDVLNDQKDMVIVDVGANIGVTVQHFRNFAKKVYAIEPSPEHFAALKQNKEFNHWDNVEIFNYALADKDGEMVMSQNDHNRTMNTLMVGEHEPGASKIKLKEEVSKMAGIITAEGYNSAVTVVAKGIDTFFEENNIEHVDFMKFDPEGSENMILKSPGFLKVYQKITAIECEFHLPDWQELVAFMKGLGFTPRRYDSSAIIVLFTR